jgi:hypothetical protein
MKKLINLLVEGNETWDDQERSTIEKAALDVGKAFARDINNFMEQYRKLREMLIAAGEDVQPVVPIEPDVAFLKVFGRRVNFVRKDEPADGTYWGFTRSRDEIWVYSNAPHSAAGEFPSTVGNRPEFSVHELGHAYENVILAAIGTKKGRNSIPQSLLNRQSGFFPLGRFQQSQDLGRGEIFADMFIGWVYDKWATIGGFPEGPLTEAGFDRKNFMDNIMIDLIREAIAHNNEA